MKNQFKLQVIALLAVLLATLFAAVLTARTDAVPEKDGYDTTIQSILVPCLAEGEGSEQCSAKAYRCICGSPAECIECELGEWYGL